MLTYADTGAHGVDYSKFILQSASPAIMKLLEVDDFFYLFLLPFFIAIFYCHPEASLRWMKLFNTNAFVSYIYIYILHTYI
jgi:hypothetical protein